MIFVTVGTHEQQFDRLIKEMDRLKKEDIILDEVFIQTGFSTYEPKYCESSPFLNYEQMESYIEKSRIVITHGGPASFLSVLNHGKNPIIVPRQLKFDEHVNDHQLEFVLKMKNVGYDLIVVEDIALLEANIINHKNKENKFDSNNKKFNELLKQIVEDIC